MKTKLRVRSGKRQYGIRTHCALASRLTSQSELVGTNEYTVCARRYARPRGASPLCLIRWLLSRQEAPYPAAASGGFHGDARAARAKFRRWLFCARLITIFHCFSRAIVPAEKQGKNCKKGMTTLLASVRSNHFATQRSTALRGYFLY